MLIRLRVTKRVPPNPDIGLKTVGGVRPLSQIALTRWNINCVTG